VIYDYSYFVESHSDVKFYLFCYVSVMFLMLRSVRCAGLADMHSYKMRYLMHSLLPAITTAGDYWA